MEMKTITAHLEDDVLLPCSCPERSLHREVKWQMEEPIKRLLLKYNGTSITSVERKGNVRIFLPDKSENCSVLLINVSVSDQGQYRCIFHSKTYQKVFVNLNLSGKSDSVFYPSFHDEFILLWNWLSHKSKTVTCRFFPARYKVCQNDSAKNLSDAKVFQCDAVGSYPEAEIQWILGGQPLEGSLNVNITHKKWQRAPGIYQFSSTLIIKLNNETTQPTCHVKSEHVSNNIEEGCDGNCFHLL